MQNGLGRSALLIVKVCMSDRNCPSVVGVMDGDNYSCDREFLEKKLHFNRGTCNNKDEVTPVTVALQVYDDDGEVIISDVQSHKVLPASDEFYDPRGHRPAEPGSLEHLAQEFVEQTLGFDRHGNWKPERLCS